MKDNNYYVVHGWMINRLHLTGNTLLCYAVIYGFSQDGVSMYMGSLNYLKEWLNVSQPTIIKALKDLCEKGLITKQEKDDNNVRTCYYAIVPEVIETGIAQAPKQPKAVAEMPVQEKKEKTTIADLFPEDNPEAKHEKWFKENFPTLANNKRPLKLRTLNFLLAKYSREQIVMKLNAMESMANFNRKYTDVGRTLGVWLERDSKPVTTTIKKK